MIRPDYTHVQQLLIEARSLTDAAEARGEVARSRRRQMRLRGRESIADLPAAVRAGEDAELHFGSATVAEHGSLRGTTV